MPVQTALLFETPEAIYLRIFRQLRPRTPPPRVRVDFRAFANANSFIRLHDGVLHVRITDVLQAAPAPIQEALAYILIGKLYREPIPKIYPARYRRYLNRAEIRRHLILLRQVRGRKFVSGPAGEQYDLDEIFEELNQRFFQGLMARPLLGWSRRPSRTMLGHYDPSHNAIILSRALDRPGVPRLAVQYVLFHEMLHLRHGVQHNGWRRCVHTPEFRQAEREFPRLKEAKQMLRQLE